MSKPLVIWNDATFAIGIESIDHQHKILVGYINELHYAIENNNTNAVLKELFKKLYDYTRYHFKEEESYFFQLNKQDFKLHQLQHKHFIEELDRMLALNDHNVISADLLYFLTDWLMSHILSEDKKFIRNA